MTFPAGFPVLFPSQLPMRVPVVGQVRCGLQDFLPHEADDVGAAVGLEANAFLFEQFPLLRPAGAVRPALLTTRWQGSPAGAETMARPTRRAWPGMPISRAICL